jgi:hypothetical protein
VLTRQERNDLEMSMMVSQIRSTAVDLLRALGMDHSEAHKGSHEVARLASQVETNSAG